MFLTACYSFMYSGKHTSDSFIKSIDISIYIDTKISEMVPILLFCSIDTPIWDKLHVLTLSDAAFFHGLLHLNKQIPTTLCQNDRYTWQFSVWYRKWYRISIFLKVSYWRWKFQYCDNTNTHTNAYSKDARPSWGQTGTIWIMTSCCCFHMKVYKVWQMLSLLSTYT